MATPRLGLVVEDKPTELSCMAIAVLLDPIRLFFYLHMAMVPSISNATLVNHNSVSLGCHHRWQMHRSICEKWAVLQSALS